MGTQQMILMVVATIVAGVLLFLLAAIQERSQAASEDAVQYYAAKQDLMHVVQMVERDFRNIGSFMYYDAGTGTWQGTHMAPGTVIQPGWYDSTAVTGGYRYTLRFYAQTDSLAAPDTVRYVWAPNGRTATLSDGTVRTLYTLQRYVGGTLTGWTDELTRFRVTLRQIESQPAMINLEDARVFRVSIRGVSPLGVGDVIEETQFDAEYRPLGIAITDHLPS